MRRLWLVGLVLAAAVSLAGHHEVVNRTVNNWTGGVCSGSQRCWSNMTSAWYLEITNPLPVPLGQGGDAWFPDGQYIDGNIVDSDFTDPDFVAWGRDFWNDRPDDVDVEMVGLHGLNASGNGRWTGRVRIDEAGDGNCNAWQGHMDFGDVDAEFLHLSSCVSMDETEWHPEWSQSFHGLHQINAFHGIMYIWCQGYPDRYRDFADDAFDIPIALAWLDNMYDRVAGADNDQCPVSRGVGVGANGQANTWARMFTERYNNVHSDPTNPTWHGVIYMTPCNPSAGDPL